MRCLWAEARMRRSWQAVVRRRTAILYYFLNLFLKIKNEEIIKTVRNVPIIPDIIIIEIS